MLLLDEIYADDALCTSFARMVTMFRSATPLEASLASYSQPYVIG